MNLVRSATTTLLILFLTACGNGEQPIMVTKPQVTNIPTVESTRMASPPIGKPWATYTRFPTSTITPTLVPTPTLGPTMTNAEAMSLMLTLFEPSPNCQLPCFGDVYPGETPWEEVRDFYLGHGLLPDKDFNGYRVEWAAMDNGVITHPWIKYITNYPKDPKTVEAIAISAGLSTNERLISSEPDYYNKFTSFSLPSVLARLGKPTKVLVFSSYYGIESGEHHFSIYIDFIDRGNVFMYNGDAKLKGDQYLLCPLESTFSNLTWSIEKSNESVVEQYRNDQYQPLNTLQEYKDLENATEITLDEFYETFRDATSHPCLETPQEIWK